MVVQKKNINDYGNFFPIGIHYHISGILKHYIAFGKAKIGVHLSLLNFSEKLYIRKHALDIVPHNITYFDDVTPENNLE